MGMSIWEYNGSGNQCLTGLGTGMGLKLMGSNGKAESHSRTPIITSKARMHKAKTCYDKRLVIGFVQVCGAVLVMQLRCMMAKTRRLLLQLLLMFFDNPAGLRSVC